MGALCGARPELQAFITSFYCRCSTYWFRGGDGERHLITANEGVEQGDVIAPVLFAYGLKPALVAAQREGDRLAAFFGVPSPKLFAYLDDIVICADPLIIEDLLEFVELELSRSCGLQLEASKLQAWSPSGSAPPGRLAACWARDGIVLLGAPLDSDHNDSLHPGDHASFLCTGSSFGARFLAKRLAHMEEVASSLLALPGNTPANFPALHSALLLLVWCLAPKADHLFRLLPPEVTSPLALGVDRLLLETFSQLFEVVLSTGQAQQLGFSLSEGGFGLRPRGGGFAAASYIGSWVLTYSEVVAATGSQLPDGDLGVCVPGSVGASLASATRTLGSVGKDTGSFGSGGSGNRFVRFLFVGYSIAWLTSF